MGKKCVIVAMCIAAIGAILVAQFSFVSAEQQACSDVFVVFARGSGQPPPSNDPKDLDNKKELATFFNEIKARTPANVSVETRELEYPAAGGPLPGSFPIWLNAELPWNAAGTYYTSVTTGVANLNTLLNEQVRQCPDQKFILGGYSQGAHVVGDTLYMLGEVIKNNIVYVGLFGDPKFRVDSYAARGDYKRMLGGILEARNTDFPFEFNSKLQSWCKEGDGICEDNVKVEIENKSLHNTYSASEIPMAANHASQLLKQHFTGYQFKSIHPGLMAEKLDVMYVVDTTATMQGVVNNLVANTSYITSQTIGLGTDTRIGLVQYNDSIDGCGIKKPETLLDLTSNFSQFAGYFSFLSASCGGSSGDDTYGGLWKAIHGQAWRSDARKVIILLAGNTPNNPDKFNAGINESGIVDAAKAAGITIYSVIRGDSAIQKSTHLPLIEKTGGKIIFMKSGITSEYLKMYDNLALILTDMPNLPVAKLFVDGSSKPGYPLNFNAGGSYDPNGAIVRYDWDFNNDGNYEETTTSPLVAHTFANSYDGLVTVQVFSADGGSAIASTSVSVNVSNIVKQAPLTPNNVVANLNPDGSISLSWQLEGGDPDESVVVRNDTGDLIATVPASLKNITITTPPKERYLGFLVQALNSVGLSQPVASNQIAIPNSDSVVTSPSDSAATPSVETSINGSQVSNSTISLDDGTIDTAGSLVSVVSQSYGDDTQSDLTLNLVQVSEGARAKWYVLFLPSLLGTLPLSRFLLLLLE